MEAQNKPDTNPLSAQQLNSTDRAKEIPKGIKLLVIIHYIGAALLVLMGIIGFSTNPGLGIFFIICAIIAYFVVTALGKGKNWARIFLIVLYILNAVAQPILWQINNRSAIESLVIIIINLALAWYLAYDKKVKLAFENQ